MILYTHTHTHTHTHGTSFNKLLNTIILGDSYKIIKEIPNKSIDLIIIDPPYEISAGGGGGAFGSDKRKYHKSVEKMSNGITNDILDELVRVQKKINIYIWCNKKQFKQYINYFENRGCTTDLLTWHKTNPVPTCNNKYLSDTEYILYFRQGSVPMYGNYRTKRKYYITPTNKGDKQKYKHPTIKPLAIIKNLIINSSNEGDIVLDCFSGSGTTCVAAKELNRKYIGIEIDPEYYKISIDRLEGILENGQISMFIN